MLACYMRIEYRENILFILYVLCMYSVHKQCILLSSIRIVITYCKYELYALKKNLKKIISQQEEHLVLLDRAKVNHETIFFLKSS